MVEQITEETQQMPVEQRVFKRFELNEELTIKSYCPNNGFDSFLIHTKDISRSGIAGAFFGSVDPLYNRKLILMYGAGIELELKLVWSYKNLELVYFTGFTFSGKILPIDNGLLQQAMKKVIKSKTPQKSVRSFF